MGGVLDFEKPLAELEARIEELKTFSREQDIDLSREIKTLEEKADALRREIYDNLTPWQRIMLARHPHRPTTLDYIQRIFDDFIELHGDRCFREDAAIVGGIARLAGRPVTVIGTQKGRDTKENLARNFGSPHPEGYRKACRLMKQAEKFGRPVICFIDVVGAYPGIEAEERGQGVIIAQNLAEMMCLQVPVVAVVTGEGGSGGALAIGVADRLIMLQNAYFSVISPEGCAAILWKDASRAKEAADVLRLTAGDLLALGVADEVLPEPRGAAHKDYDAMAGAIKEALMRHLSELCSIAPRKLVDKRYSKYRSIGLYQVRESPSLPRQEAASHGE
ncbi:MAG TPA: acetyl-CoA carboxylase carboxyltransferase subunit alpha [Firmicutes bacterium]|nr:acetyl-CoA carboxylase carboxyltransferase subunit alpha [Bacillota bacterium]